MNPIAESELQTMLESPEISAARALVPLSLHVLFDTALRLAFTDGAASVYKKFLTRMEPRNDLSLL